MNRTEQNRTGIPIGNLTSQVFSNIYLNEFDRYVRHVLKPQAYVRYGDDFVLFAPTRQHVFTLRHLATVFLAESLGLSVNPKNTIVIAARQGLKFLGHDVTAAEIAVDRHTTRRALQRITPQNIASYKALTLEPHSRQRLDWILLQEDDYPRSK